MMRSGVRFFASRGRGKRPARRRTENFEFDYIPKQWFWNPPPTKLEENKETSGWTPQSIRTGVMARKVGMSTAWDEWGTRLALTYLYIEDNYVVSHKTKEKHGYDSVVMGYVATNKQKHVKKPQRDQLERIGTPMLRKYREFRVTPDAFPAVGAQITAQHFRPSQYVVVQGTSKGKGFAGAMKRHGFRGGSATHGNTKAHRTLGSTGGTQDPGRVWPGKKMPGRMGGKSATVWNLRVHKVIPIFNTIAVVGSVPGPKNGLVSIRDSNLPWLESVGYPPFPAYERQPDDRIEHDPDEVADEDIVELVGEAPLPWHLQQAKDDGWHVPTMEELKPRMDRARLFQIEAGTYIPDEVLRNPATTDKN